MEELSIVVEQSRLHISGAELGSHNALPQSTCSIWMGFPPGLSGESPLGDKSIHGGEGDIGQA